MVAISVFLIAVTAMMVVLYRLTRCIHAWELVDKTELPSGIENIIRAGVKGEFEYNSWDLPKLAKRTVIIAMRCPKCGAAKIYKESA